MKYIAIEKIDKYNIGDEVPSEKAQVWNSMYKSPVCKEVSDSINNPIIQEKKEEKKVIAQAAIVKPKKK